MVTKTKIKNQFNPGTARPKSELIEEIQRCIESYNNGFKNMKHVVIGLFIASGLPHEKATIAFEKIQTVEVYSRAKFRCYCCGDKWNEYIQDCPNCGAFNLPF